MSEILFPPHIEGVIDVTKPPFCAVPDGKTDCTAALCAAMDFVLSQYKNAFLETRDRLAAMPDDNALLSFEIRKSDGRLNVPFPQSMPCGAILYFPAGTYLVSDTVSYSDETLYNLLFNVRWLEMNALIRMVGQNRDKTVIRLADSTPAFAFGARRPVVSFMKGEKSGVAMTNIFKNMTIDIGKNNPGAVGLRFFSNNSGTVSDVVIKSSDPQKRGYAGLEIVDEKVSCALVRNLSVEGFDYAVRMTAQQHNAALEHIDIRDQRIAGIYHSGSVLTVRDLHSRNAVTAVFTVGFTAQLVLTDSLLTGGNPDYAAVNAEYGFCYVRGLRAEGYGLPLKTYFDRVEYDRLPYEYSSHGVCSLWEDAPDPSFFDTAALPDPPAFETDYRGFVSVRAFGAVGDGKTDDTDAIRRALNSTAKGVYFEAGRYLITDTVHIGSQIQVVDFLFCDLLVGEALAHREGAGVFAVDTGDAPLLLCNLFAWESFHGLMTLIDHAGKRTLVMRMLHAQAAALYQNSVPGSTVFIESCACTVGGIPGAGMRQNAPLPGEETLLSARHIPCFAFHGQTVYARQMNPERALVEVLNDGGRLTVLGFKTEEEGTAFLTVNGGVTQLLGGICCIGGNQPIPLIENRDSHCLAVLSTMITNPGQRFPTAVSDIRTKETRLLPDRELPKRAMLSYVIPRYIG